MHILTFQVLGFAAFFALVLKKIDQEEFGEPQIDVTLGTPGKQQDLQLYANSINDNYNVTKEIQGWYEEYKNSACVCVFFF